MSTCIHGQQKRRKQSNSRVHTFTASVQRAIKNPDFRHGRRGERYKEMEKRRGGGLQTEYFLSVLKFLFEVEVNLLNTEWTEINK